MHEATGTLQIMLDKGGLLIAEQPKEHIGILVLQSFLFVFLLLSAFFLFRAKRRAWLVLPAVGLLIVMLMTKPDQTCQISIDHPHGTISWRTFTARKKFDAQQVKASDLKIATVQAAGQNGRLLLVRKDGPSHFRWAIPTRPMHPSSTSWPTTFRC